MGGRANDEDVGEWDYARLGRGKRATGQDMVREEDRARGRLAFR